MTLESETSGARPQFGGRTLDNEGDVFKHNAWDNVEWGQEQQDEAQQLVDKNAEILMEPAKALEHEEKAAEYWDKFYSIHQNRFFKERNWLFTEFPDLAPDFKGPVRVLPTENLNKDSEDEIKTSEQREVNQIQSPTGIDQSAIDKTRENETYIGENSTFRLLEIGCGTGSTVYPILEMNNSSGLMIYCCDLSQTAVQLVKDHPQYAQRRCFSWVCDVTQQWDAPFPDNSLDVVTLIFVLSAICPEKMRSVVKNIVRYLKPGGTVLFRDYGRYDLAQLRFKQGKCIQQNFYARGDGTCCYFFTQEELRDLFVSEGLVEQQNLVDRRLQVNRGKKLKMYRVWLQAKYTKPIS